MHMEEDIHSIQDQEALERIISFKVTLFVSTL
jgi:hypothetical protein